MECEKKTGQKTKIHNTFFRKGRSGASTESAHGSVCLVWSSRCSYFIKLGFVCEQMSSGIMLLGSHTQGFRSHGSFVRMIRVGSNRTVH